MLDQSPTIAEIIAKLSKPNVPSKQTLGREYEVNEGVQPIETFVASESATNFKGFEALHNIVLDINDQLLCSDVQTEAEQLRRFSETLTN